MFDPNALLLLAALASMPDTVARPTANDSVLASVVGPLVKLGARARVHTGFGIIEGETQTVDPLGLRLRQEAADIWSGPRVKPIAWSQIDRIELRTHESTTGVKTGAVVGCLLGLASVASLSASAEASGGTGSAGGPILLGGVVGALIGGAVGALFDVSGPPWKLVYERR